MKNIKGRMVRKLKTLTKSPSWRNPSIGVVQHKNPSLSEKFIPRNSMACPKLQELAEAEESEAEEECEAEKWPPGGKEGVVLYSTSLRGIRKTFEDCSAIRFLLGSFGVAYSERDVSMHMEYREELWRILGGRVVPPRLFIRGRCIGGADEVVGLHERGMLQPLLQGMPLSPSTGPCTACGGVRFLLCRTCNGSRRVMAAPHHGPRLRCLHCNENGLIKCSLCT